MLYDDKVTRSVRPTKPTKNAVLFYLEPFLIDWMDSSDKDTELLNSYINFLINLPVDAITDGVSICKILLTDFDREDVAFFDEFYQHVYLSALNKTINAWKIAYNVRDEGDIDANMFRRLRY